MLHDKWKKRIDWCLKFGDVIELLDEVGAPDSDNVGAAHVAWGDHGEVNGPGGRPLRARIRWNGSGTGD